MFDRWDQTLQNDTDTEANLVIATLCVGVAFALGSIVVRNQLRALSSASVVRGVLVRAMPAGVALIPIPPEPTSSPPSILRV